MKLSKALLGLAAFTHSINAVAVPGTEAVALDTRAPHPEFEYHTERTANEELWKRKGGGGGGGRGGSSGGGSSSGGSSGGGSSSGGRGGSSSSGGRGSPSSSTNNQGGSTTTGSGPKPQFGGGRYYGGGATKPYAPGGRSPSGIAPALLTGAAIGGIGFLGLSAAYAYGAWSYPYNHYYPYHNATTNMNETKPVSCLCDKYNPCGCDDNGNQTYFNEVIGDGSYTGLNHTIVDVVKNTTTGNETIYINGMLPNGTTAAGGTESPNAAGNMIALAQAVGWWPAATMAFALAFLI